MMSQGFIDPLANLDFDMQSFDIKRVVSVYPDRDGIVWWTKAWFNGKKKGERAIEISRQSAIDFINRNIIKDEWLEQFNTFSIYQILPQIIELWGLNVQTEVQSKKNFAQLSGK